jgi:hypothetical protein
MSKHSLCDGNSMHVSMPPIDRASTVRPASSNDVLWVKIVPRDGWGPGVPLDAAPSAMAG